MAERKHTHHIEIDDLSAFADGEIRDQAELARIEEHLAQCESCREELQQLQAVSSLLSSLPEPDIPRSFRLRPEDLPASEPTPMPLPWFMRYQSTFRAAAMAAVLVLAVIVTIDVGPFDRNDTDQVDSPAIMTDPAPTPDVDDPAVAPDEELDAVEEEEDAPVADEDTNDVGIAGVEEEPEADRDEEPAVEPDTDVEMAPESEPAPETDQPDDTRAAQEFAVTDDDGLSTLQYAMIGTGLIAVILLVIGFVLPRWWASSARRP